jgi:hypothetical protein
MEQIDIVDNISKVDFQNQYFNKQKPVVITNGINDWFATKNWSLDYFAKAHSTKKVNVGISQTKVFSYSKVHEKTKGLMKIQTIDMKDLIDNLLNEQSEQKYYLVHQSVPNDFKELMQDFTIPSWADQNKTYSIHLWVGAKGNTVPLHWDSSHNFLAQIYGDKILWLFSPDQSNLLYPTYTEAPHNHSGVPNIENPNFDIYPKFKEAKHCKVTLKEGSVLFIPSGWWHQVRSLSNSVSLNFWWSAKFNECDLTQVLRYRVSEAFINNKFSEVPTWLDLEEFSDHLETAHYLIKKGLKWPAVIFASEYAREKLNFFENDQTISKEKDLAEFEKYLSHLASLAIKEDDTLLDNYNINEVITRIKDFSMETIA